MGETGGGRVKRTPIGLVIAGLAAVGGMFGQGGMPVEMRPSGETLRAFGYGGVFHLQQTPFSPSKNTRANLAKIRDLNFFRGGAYRRGHHYKGIRMSVAEGQRRAQKVRNRQRHKKQWKKAVR